MPWDGKNTKKSSPFNTKDCKSRTKFLRIYVKSHNTYIVKIYYLAQPFKYINSFQSTKYHCILIYESIKMSNYVCVSAKDEKLKSC